MRVRPVVLVSSIAAIFLTGCTSHLAFVEVDHWGLKAEMSAESSTPANVHIGVKRSVIAFIPQLESKKNKGDSNGAENTPKEEDKSENPSSPPNNELTSFYTSYDANVGINDPFYVDHFLATGEAAVKLMADKTAIEKLQAQIQATRRNRTVSPGADSGKTKE